MAIIFLRWLLKNSDAWIGAPNILYYIVSLIQPFPLVS